MKILQFYSFTFIWPYRLQLALDLTADLRVTWIAYPVGFSGI